MPSPHPSPPPADNPADPPVTLSRRSFVQTLGLSAAATTISTASTAIARDRDAERARRAAEPEVLGPEPVEVTLNVNGQALTARLDPATTLLEALRVHHGLTGAKEICDRGACGGCSVLVDGRLIASCMTLALDAVGSKITTVEGLARGDGGAKGGLDPVQHCFVKHDAMQCGYCTPGLVVACRALLDKTPKPTVEQIKAGISGNICRCGTYTNIINAVLEASGQAPLMDAAPAAAKGG
jgi:aerobic-type carbon monoxide dehydrogenase small subunit (CoxS/CutS family)